MKGLEEEENRLQEEYDRVEEEQRQRKEEIDELQYQIYVEAPRLDQEAREICAAECQRAEEECAEALRELELREWQLGGVTCISYFFILNEASLNICPIHS